MKQSEYFLLSKKSLEFRFIESLKTSFTYFQMTVTS